MRNIIPIIFYGNIFYGLCAVTLCIEANLQHGLTLNGPFFYILVFILTVFYYSGIYYRSKSQAQHNPRTVWYATHYATIRKVLVVIAFLIFADVIFLTYRYEKPAIKMPLLLWMLVLAFPLVAILYTYRIVPFLRNKQLRAIGWLKPFFIGFSWAGIVSVYPVLFRQMQSGLPGDELVWPSGLFWLQNFLFIAALAVVFDIKDFKSDVYFRLKTYPAMLGVKSTNRFVVIPLALLSAGALFLHQWQHHSALPQYLLQTIPYFLLFAISGMVYKQRTLLFYLVWVDGLMLLKGLCGIAGILFF